MSLRWGFVGCGKIANDFALAIRAGGNSENKERFILQAAATSSSKERAVTFAELHDIPTDRAYGSYDELLNDDTVDIVYVSCLNNQHRPVVIRCLEAGKHVLCEKPMGMNATEVEAMVETARSKNLFLMEGMWSRFFPAMRRCSEMIRTGVIGEVRHVDADFCLQIEEGPGGSRMWNNAQGGGGLLDLGIYPLSFVSGCFGDISPLRVTASGVLSKPENGVDKFMSISLLFPCGGTGQITCGMTATTPEEWVVTGTRGRICVHRFAHSPFSLTLTEFDPTAADPRDNHTHTDLHFDDSELTSDPQGCGGAVYNFPGSEGLVYEARAVASAVLSGETECTEMRLDHSLLLARTMDEARKQVGVWFPQDTDAS